MYEGRLVFVHASFILFFGACTVCEMMHLFVVHDFVRGPYEDSG